MRRSRPTATLTCRRPPATAEMCRLASMTNRRKCHAGDRENLALAEQAHSGQRAGTVHVALIMLVIRHLGGECPLGDARRCLVRARKAVRKFAVRISRNPWFDPRAESASLSGSPQSIPGYIVGFGGELRLTWIKLENAADEMVV